MERTLLPPRHALRELRNTGGISSWESSPVPHNLDFGDINLLKPVTSEEIVWLKTVNRNSAPGPESRRSEIH